MSTQPNVFTIHAGTPFLQTLSDGILDGRLLPDDFPIEDLSAISTIKVYLPTQRAARLLESIFFERAQIRYGTAATFLPRILTFVDEGSDGTTEGLIGVGDDLVEGEIPSITQPAAPSQPVSSLHRQLVLTRLIMAWGAQMEALMPASREGASPLLVPASAGDAAWLAQDLGALLDRAATERINWDNLHTLVPDDYAAFWQMSLKFLTIATKSWPAYLAENNMMEAATHRDTLLSMAAKRLAQDTRRGPVIAAGSTGTLPATADFLRTIACLPDGALVLPGLDMTLDATAWAQIGGPQDLQNATMSHPQYGLKRLVEDYLKVTRADVKTLATPFAPMLTRATILSEALRPAQTTDAWHSTNTQADDVINAFEGVTLIEAASDDEEAMAIACTLRAHVEEKTNLACLVTPDRALARRVALELERWGLAVDDSAGRPLAKTQPAILAQLILDVATTDYEPTALLSLIKHPLCRIGLEAVEIRRAARVLDLALLRDLRISGGLQGLLDAVKRKQGEGATRRVHRNVKYLAADDWAVTEKLLHALIAAFTPLDPFLNLNIEQGLAKLAAAHQDVMAMLMARPPEEEASHNISDEADKAVAKILTDLRGGAVPTFELTLHDYPDLFRALLGTVTIRARTQEDSRILILGALEARMLASDLLILAALDEGSWPQATPPGAFLSRGMGLSLGFEAPERRIGLAAHDIAQGFGCATVVLTRASKRASAPTVASRWLQRLKAVLGEEQTQRLIARGDAILQNVRLLDHPVDPSIMTAQPPNPLPPVEVRPRRMSVTQVETWIRDPYAIYARNILNLSSLNPLGDTPNASTRGTLIHKSLETFAAEWQGQVDDAAHARLRAIAQKVYQEGLKDFPDIYALWWPRFDRIANAYLSWESFRTDSVEKRFTEMRGEWNMSVDEKDFLLTGEADRIDILKDGTLSLIDFKTGGVPTWRQARTGLAAQLPLEVAMLKANAFVGINPTSVSEVGWVKLNGAETATKLMPANGSGKDVMHPDELGALAHAQLEELVRRYRQPEQGYLSRARPDFETSFEGDYDHLSRYKEWSRTGGMESGGNGT